MNDYGGIIPFIGLLVIVGIIIVIFIIVGRSDSKSIEKSEEKGYQEKASAGTVIGIIFGSLALLFLPFALVILPGIGGNPGLGF